MKRLRDYFNSLDKASREEFLSKIGMTENHLRKACSVGSTFNPLRCKRIEEATNGAITRYDLRPDAKEIWG